MPKLTRRAALVMLGTGAGLLSARYALRGGIDAPLSHADPGTFGGTNSMDMSTYMEMFNRHSEFRRNVEDIPGGVRTTTESDSPALVAQLQGHVSAMYSNLDQHAEVMCMSQSLPTLFRRAEGYRRQLTLTPTGVVAEETADDPDLVQAIRAHAQEVTGFVHDGMPAMMHSGMMGPEMMGPGGTMRRP